MIVVAESGSSERVRIWLKESRLHLRTPLNCVPTPEPLPDHITVFRSRDPWQGVPLSCTRAQRDRWDAGARTYCDAVSRAVIRLNRVHGEDILVNLYIGLTSPAGWIQGEPLSWRARRLLRAVRSKRAQHAFRAALEQAAEAYRPVRAELEPLYAAALAEQRAAEEARRRAEEARRRAEERLREAVRPVADRRCWACIHYSGHSIVAIRHVADSLQPSGEPLTAYELEDALLAIHRARWLRFEWDPGSQAETVRECQELGISISFGGWWDVVTQSSWKSGPHGPVPADWQSPGTGSSRSFGGTGGGGTGGFIGGFGTH
ncbi:hypothetical protein ACFV3R_19160 [Streptomyces sp. NPDC059740]|uniref:hypothetical protein n=1 Tax=Streptomyces sp. NPDC059740 TaxID=3346926 RepID=UPI0036508C0A